MADTNDLIVFAQGANGDRADRGIESRHIPAAGENTDQAFLSAHATALSFPSSMRRGKSTEAIGCAKGIAQSLRVSLLAIYRKPLLTRRSRFYIAKEAAMHERLLLSPMERIPEGNSALMQTLATHTDWPSHLNTAVS